jgi:hypothetical protein
VGTSSGTAPPTGPQRDITVTATLDPRRRAGTLTARRRSGTIAPRSWKGSLS